MRVDPCWHKFNLVKHAFNSLHFLELFLTLIKPFSLFIHSCAFNSMVKWHGIISPFTGISIVIAMDISKAFHSTQNEQNIKI